MNFDFDLKKFTDWLMDFITGKAKSTATDLSDKMTGFAGLLKALGISGGPVELVENGAAAVVSTAEQLSTEAKKAAPGLAAQAAEAAKAAAGKVALANPSTPQSPTVGQKPPPTTERTPA